jgi:hypothetical protein
LLVIVPVDDEIDEAFLQENPVVFSGDGATDFFQKSSAFLQVFADEALNVVGNARAIEKKEYRKDAENGANS